MDAKNNMFKVIPPPRYSKVEVGIYKVEVGIYKVEVGIYYFTFKCGTQQLVADGDGGITPGLDA